MSQSATRTRLQRVEGEAVIYGGLADPRGEECGRGPLMRNIKLTPIKPLRRCRQPPDMLAALMSNPRARRQQPPSNFA
jgi:hypothetical protein